MHRSSKVASCLVTHMDRTRAGDGAARKSPSVRSRAAESTRGDTQTAPSIILTRSTLLCINSRSSRPIVETRTRAAAYHESSRIVALCKATIREPSIIDGLTRRRSATSPVPAQIVEEAADQASSGRGRPSRGGRIGRVAGGCGGRGWIVQRGHVHVRERQERTVTGIGCGPIFVVALGRAGRLAPSRLIGRRGEVGDIVVGQRQTPGTRRHTGARLSGPGCRSGRIQERVVISLRRGRCLASTWRAGAVGGRVELEW